jgi:hypothetical protein
MVYTPESSLDRVNLFKAGQVIVITAVAPGRNKTGQYMDCECTDGKTYRTFSKYLMEDLKVLIEKGINFKEGFAALITGHIAESGNAYFTMETPSKDDLDACLKAHPIK